MKLKNSKRAWGKWESCQPAFIESGQGRLYYVKDSSGELDREYILKELKNPKRIDRFRKEIEAITSLAEHKNVIQLVDHGIYRDENKPCYVMEKADKTLKELVEDSDNVEFLLDVFDKICDGVAHIHKSFIVHRDIKPENILIFSGEPKVADLGLCLIAEGERFTSLSEAVGPRFYMAPELEDGKCVDVTASADVYSLGKILYFILSRGKIFSREKYRSRQWSIARLMDDKRLDIFTAVLDKSISISPSSRYTNACQMQVDFQNSLNDYKNHPLTTLYKKFHTIELALHASETELKSLTPEEWNELLLQSEKQELNLPPRLLAAASACLNPKFIPIFYKIISQKEHSLNKSFLASISGRILYFQNDEELSWFWLNHDHFPRIALHALTLQDDIVNNLIATSNMFVLGSCPQVLSELSRQFGKLNEDAKYNFLNAAIKSIYRDKEQFLLSISTDKNMPNNLVSLVIAGLCACGTDATLRKVFDLIENEREFEEEFKIVVGGIVLGSSPQTVKKLKSYEWKNSIIKTLLEIM